MKQSQYNIAIKLDENVYIYNSLEASLSKLSESEFNILTQSPDQIEDPVFLQKLKKTGILIPDDLDELTMIRENMYASRYSSSSLSLTIAPTADCNFRCSYCYEKGRYENTRMTEKTQKELLEFVRRNLEGRKHLDICWYGGEPLLAMEIIEKLTEEFESICAEKEIGFSAGMITNGYLLTPDTAARLNKCKISYIQVTLDGTEKVHDQRRYLKNGQGTFRRIIENLRESYDLLPAVSLRVNLDRQNSGELENVAEIIHAFDLQHKIHVYPGHVQAIDGCCHKNQCLSNEEYSEIYLQHRMKGKDMTLPPRVRHSCTADSGNGFVIGADGLIFRCWDDIGKENLACSTLRGENRNKTIYYQYLTHDPTLDTQCLDCKLLPICMGGCPRISANRKEEKKCSPYIHVLNQFLYELIRNIEGNKSVYSSIYS